MLIIEKLEQLVQMQAEAIKGIKIDKVTVWDGGKSADGKLPRPIFSAHGEESSSAA